MVKRSLVSIILLVLSTSLQLKHAIKVGDEVCIVGHIMDNCKCVCDLLSFLFCNKLWSFHYRSPHITAICIWHITVCIERGTLLDNSRIVSLEQPQKHSLHCLFDVSVCREGGYTVLGPTQRSNNLHCLGYRIDNSNTVINIGRALGQKGYCSSCTNTNNNSPEFGLVATVRGVVGQLGDGSNDVSGAPLITNVQILDKNAGCGGRQSIPPLCSANARRSVEEAEAVEEVRDQNKNLRRRVNIWWVGYGRIILCR